MTASEARRAALHGESQRIMSSACPWKQPQMQSIKHLVAPWFPFSGLLLGVLWCTVFALAIFGSDFFRPWPPVTWNDVESRMRESQIPVIIPASFVGAMMVGPLRDDSMIGALYGVRAVPRQILRVCAWIWGTTISAYCCGAVPICYLAWRSLRWDGFSPLPLGVIFASVGMWPVLGLCGAVLLRRLPPIVGGLIVSGILFGLAMIPAAISNNPFGISFLAPSPIWQLPYPFIGDITSPSLNLSRFAVFLMTTACAVVVAIVALNARWHPNGLAVLHMLPTVVVGVALLMLQPNLVARDSNLRAVCTTVHVSHVCVEHRYQTLLKPIADAVDRGLSRFDPSATITVIGPGLIGAYDRPIDGIPPTDRRMLALVGVDLGSAGDLYEYEEKLNEDVANILSYSSSCGGDGKTLENQNLQYQLYRWIDEALHDRKPGPDSGPFMEVGSDARMRSWLQDHDRSIRSCSLTELDTKELR